MDEEKKQIDLIRLDEKEKKILANYVSPKDRAKKQLKKKIKNQEKKWSQQNQVEEEEEEKRMWDVFDYIKNNLNDILIPDLEIISHIKPSETEHGFINFLWKYPVFPKRNKEEIQFSKEAVYWYQDFHDLTLEDGCVYSVMGDYLGPLGGIKFEDQKKRRHRQDLGSVHALDESDYFENVYSFYEESHYEWLDDIEYDFTDKGIDFKWSYPPYFTIFDEGIKIFPHSLWEYFLVNRLEMTIYGAMGEGNLYSSPSGTYPEGES